MIKVPELFGSNVFSDSVMRDKLPKDAYKALQKTIKTGARLDAQLADAVAASMKEWAIEKGATHYTHWFQPMTGITAEKHDSFIEPVGEGRVIMQFTGKNLIQGEPDASSFPSGGLRATFEARGYTAWDPTSPAFIKENTLCIPTAYCSYGGEVLDKKTPLLRSMEALSRQALRILRLFGNEDARSVNPTVGPEQEYFLIDQALYNQRPDLQMTGRTLFGAKPPKGQQLEDHYFGTIKTRVKEFMEELDVELWKLGILSKTEHNEVAPAQHEIAPIFTSVNVACDQNQLTMEMLKKVAARHNLACLLHEKPFAGVSGSGKHNNWSLATDLGENLLEPGRTPEANVQFLLFLVAVIEAVDIYADLLRVSTATAGNDCRLGSNEAPTTIMSIFLGPQLSGVLEKIVSLYAAPESSGSGGTASDKPSRQRWLDSGVAVLPPLPRDNTDRNRTSPIAFTGNKFELRGLGSAQSIACTNMMLDTAVADVLQRYADRLEQAQDFEAEVNKIIAQSYAAHKRVVFNGNSYSDEWTQQAAALGLANYSTAYEALPHYMDAENVALLSRHNVLNELEIASRTQVLLDNYIKVVLIEARTMISMVRRDILPSVSRFAGALARAALDQRRLADAAGIAVPAKYEEETAAQIAARIDSLHANTKALQQELEKGRAMECNAETARFFGEDILGRMKLVRKDADALEGIVAGEAWPYPTYSDLLFSI